MSISVPPRRWADISQGTVRGDAEAWLTWVHFLAEQT